MHVIQLNKNCITKKIVKYVRNMVAVYFRQRLSVFWKRDLQNSEIVVIITGFLRIPPVFAATQELPNIQLNGVTVFVSLSLVTGSVLSSNLIFRVPSGSSEEVSTLRNSYTFHLFSKYCSPKSTTKTVMLLSAGDVTRCPRVISSTGTPARTAGINAGTPVHGHKPPLPRREHESSLRRQCLPDTVARRS
jgi:hypothetical protein